MRDLSARALLIRPLRGAAGWLLSAAFNSSLAKRLYLESKQLSHRLIHQRFPWLHELIFVHLKSRARRYYLGRLRPVSPAGLGDRGALYAVPDGSAQGKPPLVSVIVPNYRHARFLRRRLDSVYSQTYPHYEVILLDDASPDDSQAILAEYAERHPDKTRLLVNRENSGSPFRQWKKGLELARGELIWIAESDDYCAADFLETLVKHFRNPAVKLAYGDTRFVEGESDTQVWSLGEYLAEIDRDLWSRPFLASAHALVNQAWARKNIVPNVSSALFRHPGALALLDDRRWQEMRVCGDWIFYLHLIRGGLVAYDPAAVNFYRLHPSNTSCRTYTEDVYYAEHERVAAELLRLYRLESPEILDAFARTVKAHWLHHRPGDPLEDLERVFSVERVLEAAGQRRPNVMMAVLAFRSGGGETFPLTLANLLHERGYAVTVFNCNYLPTEPAVRAMLDPGIAVVELKALERLPAVAADMGIEILHSHHAWVDSTLCTLFEDLETPALVVTTHGMYEAIDEADRREAVHRLARRAAHIVYVADKNLDGFRGSGIEPERFTRIENALPRRDPEPIPRASLGIPEAAFVVCLVSRAIPEKGWGEALAIVARARVLAQRDIHLVLVGDGPEYHRLARCRLPNHVHLLGFRKDVPALFAMADLGFLPSRFKGESAPLVLIECLLAGRPVLATDLGEIRRMLAADGGLAGSVVPLDGDQVNVEAMAREMARFAGDTSYYQGCLERVGKAAHKFSAERMVEKYEQVYRQALEFSPGSR